jgi:integrase
LRSTGCNPDQAAGDNNSYKRMRQNQGFQPIVVLNRALEAAFRRSGVTDISSHNLRKTFATRLLSRGAAITDVQYLLGHTSVKTTERAYAAFVKNERFKQTMLKIVK